MPLQFNLFWWSIPPVCLIVFPGSAALQLPPQDQAENHADRGRDQRAEKSAPEPWSCQFKSNTNLGTDPAGQSKEQGVDHKREQTQGQDDQKAGQGLEGWT